MIIHKITNIINTIDTIIIRAYSILKQCSKTSMFYIEVSV
jgi:hypothetical protein